MKKIMVMLVLGILFTSLVFVQAAQEGKTSVTSIRAKVSSENKIKTGEYAGENGETIRVQEESQERVHFQVGGVSATSGLDIEQEQVQDKTRLKAQLANGTYSEIKIMPDVAAERALERLRLKVCLEENNCSIELKEVGKANQTRLAYEVQIERHSRILGIFQKKMQVRAQVSAENGEIIQTNKPWWAFLAVEPKETSE